MERDGEKVEPVIGDAIVNKSWPRFLHPYPLAGPDQREAGKYFLVCAGGGGYRGQITPSVVTHSTMIDRDAVIPIVKVHTA